jgi:hypothetical protein
MGTRGRGLALLAAASAVVVGVLAAVAFGQMTSTKLDRKLCETTGGGRFVPIPGFPGESIDRRLLADIEFLVRKYKIFITDGYSIDPVHARNGEHPIGLALDIVPDTTKTRRWRKVSRLARWAEPLPGAPRPPFRWVGYNGDIGHGRGNHLHLSWSHSATEPEDPARTVYTLKCPEKATGTQPPPEPEGGGIASRAPAGKPDSGGIGARARIRAMQRTAVPERR